MAVVFAAFTTQYILASSTNVRWTVATGGWGGGRCLFSPVWDCVWKCKRDIHIEKQTDRHIERRVHIYMQTDRSMHTDTYKHTYRQANIYMQTDRYIRTYIQTDTVT
jgi:hypothetical protein